MRSSILLLAFAASTLASPQVVRSVPSLLPSATSDHVQPQRRNRTRRLRDLPRRRRRRNCLYALSLPSPPLTSPPPPALTLLPAPPSHCNPHERPRSSLNPDRLRRRSHRRCRLGCGSWDVPRWVTGGGRDECRRCRDERCGELGDAGGEWSCECGDAGREWGG